MLSLKIEQVDNGFIFYGIDDETGEPLKKVFEIDCETDLEGWKDMLFYIKEYFGLFYDKYAKQNVMILILTPDQEGQAYEQWGV